MELIMKADVESVYIGYLAEQLPLHGPVVHVGSKIPNPLPAECVVAFRTGGAEQTKVSDAPLLTVECRAKTETRAYDLMALVSALVKASDGLVLDGHQVYSVNSTGLANLPDPLTEKPRYTETFQIHIASTVTN